MAQGKKAAVLVWYAPRDNQRVYIEALTQRGYAADYYIAQRNIFADGPQAAWERTRNHLLVLSSATTPGLSGVIDTFLRLADFDGPRQMIVVRAGHCVIPQQLRDLTLVNAAEIGFDAAVDLLSRLIIAPPPQPFLQSSSSGPEKVWSSGGLRDYTPTDFTPAISVFISYSRTDGEFADELARDLWDNGIVVWVDHEQITPGTADWEHEIRKNIAKADAVIYVASESGAASQYVRDELAVARDEAVPVYPIWARGYKWSRCMPLGWGHTQYADGRGDKYHEAVASIIASLASDGDGYDD